MQNLRDSVRNLPETSGVYFFRDQAEKIIYVGKAISLKNRVSSYFSTKVADAKTKELVKKIAKIEHINTESEVEALILESEMIKRYHPKYNIVWRDDKNFVYIKITDEDYPQVILVRQIVDDRAKYIGPFVDVVSVRGLLKYLRKIFQFRHCRNLPRKACLQYSIGNCAGPCQEYISKTEYRKNIRNIVRFFEGQTEAVKIDFRKEMKRAVKDEEFEKAALYRNRISWIDKINSLNLISFEETNLKSDKALRGLRDVLRLGPLPHRIECYDISNIFGRAAVGSMVVFEDGLPKKDDYRRFEIKTVSRIDDYQMISEVLSRRFRKFGQKKADRSFSQLPDLIIIDGGKGHLRVAEDTARPFNLSVRIISLAKRQEEIFRLNRGNNNDKTEFEKIILERNSESYFLIQRIRDEAHRFAITYHRSKRGKELLVSNLDIIPGIGPKTKKKLIQIFGSVDDIRERSLAELKDAVGEKLAKKIKENL